MATHFTGRLNRSVGLLVGLALLVGLFVAGPATSQTADPAPDYLATFDACPEDVIPSSGFTDVSSRHANVADIDCIAYYGITKGTSATTYSPEDPVIREHMALFLVRMARLVGISVPRATSTPFTDISNLSETSKEAISQIYSLGITIGATATTYAPLRDVSRGEMALFLSRLMNLMEPLRDGRDYFGYIPEDVEDNVSRYDIGSPFRDLNDESVRVFDAVTQLYELGVAGGLDGSTFLYGPKADMSRAAMAEFMAGILDHSSLRPQGVTVQVTPSQGLDNYDITMMISVRDSSFAPVEDQPVDWFYGIGDDGGLDGGECDDDLIEPSGADCVWDEDDDDETDREGNIFEDRIEATEGETMTFYAWIGLRDGDEFEEHTVNFSQAEARSVEGPDSIRVTWRERDIPLNALQIEEAYVVDLDIDSIDFTIQLLDDQGNDLEMEGIAIDIEIESSDISIDYTVTASADYRPDPLISPVGRGEDESDSRVLTDDDGEASFELDGPTRDERLDTVTFIPDCEGCDNKTYKFAWSTGTPILTSVKPDFNPFQFKTSRTRLTFSVRYQQYDQYGEELSGVTATSTGRTGTTTTALLNDDFYSVPPGGTAAPLGTATNAAEVTPSGGRFSKTYSVEIPQGNRDDGFFLVLIPDIFADANNNNVWDAGEVRYLVPATDEVVVWFVTEANGGSDLPSSCIVDWPSEVDPDPPPIEVDTEEREFRTCFTLWGYDGNDRFLIEGDDVSIEDFEERLKTATLDELSVISYFTRSNGRSIFQIRVP